MHGSGMKNTFICLKIIICLSVTIDAYAARLILFNGASSAGKSSTAQALLENLKINSPDEAWKIESIDAYALESENHQKESITCGRSQEGQWINAFHQRIVSTLLKGTNVIVDHVMMNDSFFRNALYAFEGKEVFFVKVFTDFEHAELRVKERNASKNLAEHREPACLLSHYGRQKLEPNTFLRGGKTVGLGQTWGYPTHTGKIYDYEVETTHISPEQAAEAILKAYRDNPPAKFSFFRRHINLWNALHEEWEYSDSDGYWVQHLKRTTFDREYSHLRNLFF